MVIFDDHDHRKNVHPSNVIYNQKEQAFARAFRLACQKSFNENGVCICCCIFRLSERVCIGRIGEVICEI